MYNKLKKFLKILFKIQEMYIKKVYKRNQEMYIKKNS